MSQAELSNQYPIRGISADAATGEPKRRILNLGEEVTAIITPVSICMLIVVALVRGLSDGDGSENGPTIGTLYYNENANTGDSKAKKFSGALINSLIFIGAVIVLTFILFLCFKYQCSKAIWAYMGFAGFILFFGFGGGLFAEICVAIGFQLDLITFFIVLWNFSVMGVLAAFFWHSPVFLKQGYLVIVGAIVAYWFTNLAEWTTWMLLGAMAIYDLIAVLVPGGPLKLLVELAMERNEEIPALIYEARPTASTQGVRVRDRRQPAEGASHGDARQQPPPPSQMQAGAARVTVVDSSGAESLRAAQRDQGRDGGRSRGSRGSRGSGVPGSFSGERGVVPGAPLPSVEGAAVPVGGECVLVRPHGAIASHGDVRAVAPPQAPAAAATVADGPTEVARTMLLSGTHTASSRPSDGDEFSEQAPLHIGRPRPAADRLALDSPSLASPLATFPLLQRGSVQTSRSPSPVDSVRAVCCGGGGRMSVDVDSVPDDPPLQRGEFMVQGIPLVTAEGQPRQAPSQQALGHAQGWGGMRQQGAERGYLDAILNEEAAQPREAAPANIEELLGLPESIKLGLGDFIFYSLLVGRAAKYDMLTVYVCYLGIIAGLGLTLLLLCVFKKALPALPFSIALGISFYFLARGIMEPLLVGFTTRLVFF